MVYNICWADNQWQTFILLQLLIHDFASTCLSVLCIICNMTEVLGFTPSRNISRHHDSVTLWLVKWLLFRLMFASGVVKLTYMDTTWWDLSALNWHYESQVGMNEQTNFINHRMQSEFNIDLH